MANVTTNFTNIRKGAFKNVRTALVSQITGVSTRVYGSYPLTNIVLPLIVVESPVKSTDDEAYMLDGVDFKTVTVNITVYAKNAEKCDALSDEIDTQLTGYRSTFLTNGMHMTDNTYEDVDTSIFVDLKGQRSHSKTGTITLEVDA